MAGERTTEIEKPAESRRAGRWVLRLAFVLALAANLWVSLLPPEDLSAVAPVSDKVLHATGYALMTLLLLSTRWVTRVAAAIVVIVAVGLAIEVLQGLTGYRSFELLDLAADLVGAVAGGIAWTVARRAGRPPRR